MVLLNLFLSFFRIGLFSIGGAYSFLPLIEREVVQKYHWLTKTEFLDVFGITQIFPGAISIKYATYTGYKIAGIPGAIVANLGNLLAPAAIIIFASILYAKYKDLPSVKGVFNMIQLAVFAMIIAAALQLASPHQWFHFKSLLVILISFMLFMFTQIHPALIIIGAGILGIFWGY